MRAVRVRKLSGALLIVLTLLGSSSRSIAMAPPGTAGCGEVPTIAPQDPDNVLRLRPAA
jgi:hypothetical protein